MPLTIIQAINELEGLRVKHGDDTLVQCDCPRCGCVFDPDIVVAAPLVVRMKEGRMDPMSGRVVKK